MDTMRAAYHEVYVYTMGRPGFILQHVVDAFAVQSVSDDSRPIGLVFGLVGLYLRVEKQFSGRQVQRVHMELGRRKREWPRVYVPEDRGSMTVADVLAASATVMLPRSSGTYTRGHSRFLRPSSMCTRWTWRPENCFSTRR